MDSPAEQAIAAFERLHRLTVTVHDLRGDLRESRRIVGEYELDYADFRARRTFPDQICVYNKSVDIHVYDCSDAEYARYHAEFTADDRPAAGEVHGLPYGISGLT